MSRCSCRHLRQHAYKQVTQGNVSQNTRIVSLNPLSLKFYSDDFCSTADVTYIRRRTLRTKALCICVYVVWSYLSFKACMYLKTYILYLHFTFQSTFKSMSILNPSILLCLVSLSFAAFSIEFFTSPPLLLFSTFFFLWQLCILFFLILTKLFVISLTFLLQFFLSYIILSTLCMSMGCRCQTRHDHYHYPRTRTVLIVNNIASKLHKHRTYTWRLRYIGWYVILVIVYNSQHTIVNRHTFFR